jgi:hypothetical protein
MPVQLKAVIRMIIIKMRGLYVCNVWNIMCISIQTLLPNVNAHIPSAAGAGGHCEEAHEGLQQKP